MRDLVMRAAASLVDLARPHQDNGILVGSGFSLDQPLGAACRVTADHTDGLKLVHFLGDGQQQRDRPKGFAAEIHIQAGAYHPVSLLSQFVALRHNPVVKKLNLVDSDNTGGGIDQLSDLITGLYRDRVQLETIVRGNRLRGVPYINSGLENLDALLRYRGAAQTSHQLLSLAAKHATADDLDRPGIRVE